MDEFLKQVTDRFTGAELVDLLDIPVEDIVEAFRERIEDVAEDLEEFLRHGR